MNFTYIARVSDGVLLVGSMEMGSDAQAHDMEVYKTQGKQLLRKLDQAGPSRCSIESGPCCFHYMLDMGVCYLTCSSKGYPKRLAFSYLEELKDAFVQELQEKYKDAWTTEVATVGRPYAFIWFDKTIQRKRKDYADPNSRNNMGKLGDDLNDIHSIMKKNITDVLDRGQKLEHVSAVSSRLREDSKKFAWGAKKMNDQLWWKNASLAGGVLILVFLLWKLFM